MYSANVLDEDGSVAPEVSGGDGSEVGGGRSLLGAFLKDTIFVGMQNIVFGRVNLQSKALEILV